MSGLDWLNNLGLDSTSRLDTASPLPQVSFNVTPNTSNISLPLEDDETIPLTLTTQDLTKQEAKTYLRWYNDITIRRGSTAVKLVDVFHFLNNFNLDQVMIDRIKHIFRGYTNTLNMGQFFAVLRLVSHAIQGILPTRRLLKQIAPLPKPKSILSAKRISDDDYEVDETPESKVDIDSFMNLVLNGQQPQPQKRRKRRSHDKRVTFSEVREEHTPELVDYETHTTPNVGGGAMSQVTTAPPPSNSNTQGSVAETVDEEEDASLDMSLPMYQLLARMKKNSTPESKEEREVLSSMGDSLNHFQHIQNVESVSHSHVPSIFFEETPEPLKPTLTGSANYFVRNQAQADPSTDQRAGNYFNELLQPQRERSYSSPPTINQPGYSPQGISAQGISPTGSPLPIGSPFPMGQQAIQLPQMGQNMNNISMPVPHPITGRIQPPPPPPRGRSASATMHHPNTTGGSLVGDLQALQAEMDKLNMGSVGGFYS